MRQYITRRVGILLATVALALGVPLAVFASHDFTDVPNSNLFHADISALVDSGVTTGCGGGRYCPKAFVTREQMAAFMNRLGALAPGKTPVVNAAELQGSLPKVGSIELVGTVTATTPTTLDSFQVTVPGPGTLLVEVSGEFWVNADAAAVAARWSGTNWGICDTPNSSAACAGTYDRSDYEDPDNTTSLNAPPGWYRARTVQVAAAGARTFYVNAARDANSVSVNTWNTFATVTFVPGTASSLSVVSAGFAAQGGAQPAGNDPE
jgi:hypothetical protein